VGVPIASPDGRKLLTLGYREGRTEQDLKKWWLISIPDQRLEELDPPSFESRENQAPGLQAWMHSPKDRSQQWLIYGQSVGDTYNLFRVAVSSNGKVAHDPEQLTFTTGMSFASSISETGRVVFDNGTISTNLWSVPIDTNSARLAGERQSLTQVEGNSNDAPSLSRDGNKVAFFSDDRLVVKDLVSGRETQLVQKLRTLQSTPPTISPDGTFVVYYVPALFTASVTDLYLVSTAGGASRRICQDCGTPGGISSDGTHVLTQKTGEGGLDKIRLVEIATGKMTEVLGNSVHSLWNPYYSWDDKWMGFKIQTGADQRHFQLYITPVQNYAPAGPDRWIQLTNGEFNDDHEQFSPDGNTIYFNSDRDGFACIWALRLDPKTKRPLGKPFAIQHFHGSQRIYSGVSPLAHMEVNVARDKIVTNLDEFHSDIWMMELGSGN